MSVLRRRGRRAAWASLGGLGSWPASVATAAAVRASRSSPVRTAWRRSGVGVASARRRRRARRRARRPAWPRASSMAMTAPFIPPRPISAMMTTRPRVSGGRRARAAASALTAARVAGVTLLADLGDRLVQACAARRRSRRCARSTGRGRSRRPCWRAGRGSPRAVVSSASAWSSELERVGVLRRARPRSAAWPTSRSCSARAALMLRSPPRDPIGQPRPRRRRGRRSRRARPPAGRAARRPGPRRAARPSGVPTYGTPASARAERGGPGDDVGDQPVALGDGRVDRRGSPPLSAASAPRACVAERLDLVGQAPQVGLGGVELGVDRRRRRRRSAPARAGRCPAGGRGRSRARPPPSAMTTTTAARRARRASRAETSFTRAARVGLMPRRTTWSRGFARR